MNAFQLLKEDHQKVSGIFQQLEPTTERAEKTRTELFAKLKEELDIHAKIEESIFYPSIKQAAETRAAVALLTRSIRIVSGGDFAGDYFDCVKDGSTWKIPPEHRSQIHHRDTEAQLEAVSTSSCASVSLW